MTSSTATSSTATSSTQTSGVALPRSLAGNKSPWIIAVVVSIATFMEVLDTSIANVDIPLMIQNRGFAASCAVLFMLGFILFVPINSADYIGLPNNKSNEASALLNLFRNLGGSFGISLAQTWVARRSQFHQSRIVEGLTDYNSIYTEQLSAMVEQFGSLDAARQAMMLSVQKQAAMLAYLDLFYIVAILSLCALPLALLINKTTADETMHIGH